MTVTLGRDVADWLATRESKLSEARVARVKAATSEQSLHEMLATAKKTSAELRRRGVDVSDFDAALDTALKDTELQYVPLRDSQLAVALGRVGEERDCAKVWKLISEYRAASIVPEAEVIVPVTVADLSRVVQNGRAALAIRGESSLTAFALAGVDDTWVDGEVAVELPETIRATLLRMFLHAHERAIAARQDVLAARRELAVPVAKTSHGSFEDVGKLMFLNNNRHMSGEAAAEVLARSANEAAIGTPGWGGWTALALGWLGAAGSVCLGASTTGGGSANDASPIFMVPALGSIAFAFYMAFARQNWLRDVQNAVRAVTEARASREARAVEQVLLDARLLRELYENVRKSMNTRYLVLLHLRVAAANEEAASNLADPRLPAQSSQTANVGIAVARTPMPSTIENS